ncbi:CACNA1G (predicted) [Pycnogonum litorale]
MYQPCGDEKCLTKRCQTLRVFDDCIFAFFAIEMLIKMLAMGITGRGAYMADTWNRLDSFIVFAGSLEYFLNVENMNLSAIRTIRVLRPLRAINRIPSLRILVMLLLDTLPMLVNVLLLCFFVFFIFGIVGVQLWAGILRQRCFLQLPENITHTGPLSNYYTTFEQEKDYICTLPKDNGMHECKFLLPTKHGDKICNASAAQFSNNTPTNSSCVNWNQYYTLCRAGERNPFQGAISFDNIGLAWVAIFLVISLEGWTDIMYYVQDAHSFWDWIYFVLLIVIGSFFMINLCLVVIATQFSETKKRETERMRLERARFQSSSTLASGSEPTGCYEEITKYIAHLWRRAKRKLRKFYRTTKFAKSRRKNVIALRRQNLHTVIEQQQEQQQRHDAGEVSSVEISQGIITDGQGLISEAEHSVSDFRAESPLVPHASPEVSDIEISSPKRSVVICFDEDQYDASAPLSSSTFVSSYSPSSKHQGTTGSAVDKDKEVPSNNKPQSSPCRVVRLKRPSRKKRPSPSVTSPRTSGTTALTCAELLVLGGAQSAALAASLANDKPLRSLYNRFAKGERYFSAPQLFFYAPADARKRHALHSSEINDDDSSESDSEWTSSGESKPDNCLWVFYKSQQGKVKTVVDHRYFQNFILLSILVNTLSMGIEYHNQPDELTVAVETSNMVFTGIFAFEMLLKIIADGFFGYLSNGFNLFDGVIVVLSLIELCQSSNGGSGLSVLRTFRLLRILKLVRFLPALRRQLYVMLRTMDNVAVFFSLLILFIFIFSILGMNLFGCKFCRKTTDDNRQCDRKNFDSLLWAIVTVFQILTQEDWNVVLFNGMEKTSYWAALYFIILMTFGNYVLFNLLVAILVEGFSAEEEKKKCLQQTEEEKKSEEKNAEYTCCNLDQDKFGFEYEPKDNIEKEYKMMVMPSVSIVKMTGQEPKMDNFYNNNNRCGAKNLDALPCPPVITRTAATPQGSPNATLEPLRDNKMCLSPEMVLNISTPSSLGSNSYENSSVNFPSTSPHSHSPSTRSFLLRPSTQQNIVKQSRGTPVPVRRNITPCSQDSSRAISRSSCSPVDRQDSCNSNHGTSPKLQRKNSSTRSRKGSWRNRWKRKSEKEYLVSDSDNSPGSDADVDIMSSLNNRNMSICSPQDHAHCNGGLPTIINTPNNKRNIQQNSAGSCNLSPQNSFKDHSNPPSPRSPSTKSQQFIWNSPNYQQQQQQLNTAPNSINSVIISELYGSRNLSPQHSVGERPSVILPSRQNSLTISFKDEYKPNNLSSRPQIRCDPESLPVNKQEPKIKFLGLFEPRGCMKERTEYSLFIFSSNNRLRIICSWLNDRKWFDYCILFFIALNCITLAMERPMIPPGSDERILLAVSNYSFTVIFAFEMFIKVVAVGLWYGDTAYLKTGWNIMDGILVVVSLIDLFISFVADASPRIFGILRVFRLLRSLRPLRVINRAPGLKLVVQTLLSSLRPIGNIVLICCTFFIIFGILGVQLFKGSFYYCHGLNIKDIRNRTDCLNSDPHNEWVNRRYNFDDLGQALMALFVLSSKDGWVNIMYNGLDAVGVDQQPQENYNEWRLLYFISFLLLVGFFVLNMFVGVVVENFHRCREEQEKEEKARRAEKRACKMEKKRRSMLQRLKMVKCGLREPPYYKNYSRPRLFIHSIVTSKYFDLAIAAVIGLNVVTMAMEFYKMPPELSYALRIFNYFFTAVFILESAMKTLALGSKRYIIDRWNQLDVIIVLLSIIGIVLEEMESEVIPINPTIIRVMRVLRIARVLKLLKMAKGIRALLDTVMQALPQVGNLGLLFFLLFFIFAALGVELFGRLECNDDFPCQGLGEHAHFRNFGMAFLTLFRVATGDNWNGIMKDTLRDNCDSSSGCVRNCCVSPIITPLYFVIFVLMAQFVLVNVVVAVLMKHLEESHRQMDDDVDMDLEIERELAEEQQRDEVLQQTEVALRALQCPRPREDEDPFKYFHKPIYKISSLPANFTFTFDGDGRSSDGSNGNSCESPGVKINVFDSHIAVPTILSQSLSNQDQELSVSIPILEDDDVNDVNIKVPSPEGVVEKVTVADLRNMIHSSAPTLSSDNREPIEDSTPSDSASTDCEPSRELPLLEGIKDKFWNDACSNGSEDDSASEDEASVVDKGQGSRCEAQYQGDVESSRSCNCGSTNSEQCTCARDDADVWCVDRSSRNMSQHRQPKECCDKDDDDDFRF